MRPILLLAAGLASLALGAAAVAQDQPAAPDAHHPPGAAEPNKDAPAAEAAGMNCAAMMAEMRGGPAGKTGSPAPKAGAGKMDEAHKARCAEMMARMPARAAAPDGKGH